MIYKSQNETAGVYHGTRVITAVYRGNRLVWEPASCCFSRGLWLNNLPWKNTDGWKNNT